MSIHALVEYLRRLDDRLVRSFRGSPVAEIARYEAMVGRSLPEFYRSFLQLAGDSDGREWVGYGGTVRLEAVMEAYATALSWHEEPPAEGVLIAVSSFWYDQACLWHGPDATEPKVVLWADEIYQTWASSFERHAWVSAFEFLELRRQPAAMMGAFVDPSSSLPALRQRIVANGISPEWFSDDYNLQFRLPDLGVVVSLSKHDTRPVQIGVGGASSGAVWNGVRTLRALLGATTDFVPLGG